MEKEFREFYAVSPPTQTRSEPFLDSRRKIAFHVFLFLLTLVTTTLAGAEHTTNKHLLVFMPGESWPSIGMGWSDIAKGIPFSIAFLSFLTVHEFGHYFTALYYRVRCSLPYYIPIFLPGIMNIGSMGAVIRIRDLPDSKTKFFDIGIAGPLAGFVVSLMILWFGFANLPPLEYLYEANPEYQDEFGGIPTEEDLMRSKPPGGMLLTVGNTLLFTFFEEFVADPERLPNHFEIIHYPLLFVGFLTLFFTALNLLPIGQLDGGHVTFGLFGRRYAGIISRLTVMAMLIYSGLGVLDFNHHQPYWYLILGLYLLFLFFITSSITGMDRIGLALVLIGTVIVVQQIIQFIAVESLQPNPIWFVFATLATKLIGLDHPEVDHEEPLTPGRKVLGWCAIGIFIICFSPQPLYFTQAHTYKFEYSESYPMKKKQAPPETLEAYLLGKKVDTAAFQQEQPELWHQLETEYRQLGFQGFDQRKKFFINDWRLAFPPSPAASEEQS